MEASNYDHYGLSVFIINGREYAVGNDSQCYKACEQYIRESLWAFNAGFLAGYLIIDDIEVIQAIQAKYEDGNDSLFKLVNDWYSLVEDAIGADGMGHFLASYDGEERKLRYLISNENLDSEDKEELFRYLSIEDGDLSDWYVYRLS